MNLLTKHIILLSLTVIMISSCKKEDSSNPDTNSTTKYSKVESMRSNIAVFPKEPNNLNDTVYVTDLNGTSLLAAYVYEGTIGTDAIVKIIEYSDSACTVATGNSREYTYDVEGDLWAIESYTEITNGSESYKRVEDNELLNGVFRSNQRQIFNGGSSTPTDVIDRAYVTFNGEYILNTRTITKNGFLKSNGYYSLYQYEVLDSNITYQNNSTNLVGKEYTTLSEDEQAIESLKYYYIGSTGVLRDSVVSKKANTLGFLDNLTSTTVYDSIFSYNVQDGRKVSGITVAVGDIFQLESEVKVYTNGRLTSRERKRYSYPLDDDIFPDHVIIDTESSYDDENGHGLTSIKTIRKDGAIEQETYYTHSTVVK